MFSPTLPPCSLLPFESEKMFFCLEIFFLFFPSCSKSAHHWGRVPKKRILGSLLSFNLGDRDVVAPLVGGLLAWLLCCYPQLTSDITISARLNFIVPFFILFLSKDRELGDRATTTSVQHWNGWKISCMSQKTCPCLLFF